jgi:hypothetical protein
MAEHDSGKLGLTLARLMREGLDRLRRTMDQPGEGSQRVRITNSQGLLALMADARHRNANRQASDKLLDVLDPGGVHIMAFQFVHNDVELRTQWLVKARDGMNPIMLWLDVSFEALAECSVEVHRQPSATQAPEAEA